MAYIVNFSTFLSFLHIVAYILETINKAAGIITKPLIIHSHR